MAHDKKKHHSKKQVGFAGGGVSGKLMLKYGRNLARAMYQKSHGKGTNPGKGD